MPDFIIGQKGNTNADSDRDVNKMQAQHCLEIAHIQWRYIESLVCMGDDELIFLQTLQCFPYRPAAGATLLRYCQLGQGCPR
jgi:hypothetical protein